MSGKHADDDRDGTINRNDPDSPLYEPTADEVQARKAERPAEAARAVAAPRSVTAAASGSPVAWGLDAASEISLTTMRSEGASFVCLYLAPGGTSSWKVRSLASVHNYLAAGFSVVLNWESTGTPTGGWSTGVSAAQQSQAQINAYRNHCSACAAKIAADIPVYFNFADLESPNHTDLANATNGAASVVGHARTGGYGGYATIKWLFDQGLITWGWQTYAWSSGNRDPRAQLYQRLNTATIDYDVAYAADYGQVPRPAGSAPAPAAVSPTSALMASGVL